MSPSQKSHFKLLQKFKPDYSPSEFVQYESERTGMRVVVIDQKGPKVTGYFVLATEIHDDSGAPHTLEHLCFMGSRNYQYKGFLDKLATRVYSNTNAWTATDHTAYTLDTAGWEGFAQILPVYLEHVIAPTLTDEGCYTEVHHVDGTGNDAGVVYSEMQGVQNNAAELIDLSARRLTYPHGVGFRYETGGMMEQLRVLTAERIREFHREMYQPKNLCLIITGEVDHANMLETLDKFEDTILDAIPSPDAPFKRPWLDTKQAPPLEKSIVEKVEFPEEDESFGEIEIRFLGPDCTDPVQTGAVNVALLYLAGSSASLLDNILVEKEQLASAVYYVTEDHPSVEIRFTLTSVETDKLAQVEQRFFEVLKDAMQKELDMKYLRECIDRQRRTWKFSTESSASSLAEYVISDFLYGKRDGSTLLDVATLKEYDILEQWSENEWRNFIKKWISEAPHVTILGVPSMKMSETLKKEEEARVTAQKKRLGDEGLKQLAKKLEKAKAENDKEIPKEMLEKFPIPGVESIHFVETTTARSGTALKAGRPDHAAQKLVDADGSDMPLFIHFEHIPSNFVQLSLLISAQSVPVQLRPLLSIYTEAFFNLPVNRDGKTINFEQVVVELERDTVGYSMEGARSLGNSEMLRISFQVELEKYSTAIAWLQELSWNSIFEVERLRAITSRLLSDVPDSKRSGDDMLAAVHVMVHYAAESIVRARSTLVKARYLKRIKRQLAEEPELVVARMEEIRKALFQFENMRVLVIADLEKLTNPVSAWKPYVERLGPTSTLHPITARRALLSDAGRDLGGQSYIVPMPTIDSSFAYATARGLDSYNDPRLPALLVAIAYMNAVEGPLWVAVRGTGLAYGTNFAYNIDTGFVNFDVYRSPNAHKAFESSKQIVKDHLSGAIPFDPLMLEGSISSIVVSYANEQATVAGAAQGSFTRQVVRNLPSNYKEKMLKHVRNISVEDIKGALRDIILPLFAPQTANIVVTCATMLEETIKKGFQSSGFTPEVQLLKDFEDDYGLKVGDDEDEESDDDEDDDEYETGSEDDDEDDDDDE
ncbi:Metalloenzyme, LuxS/M16 peptidase-like protein [Aspergillus leporis]|uniref:Metalloenzyme, LuxS/M16 peptidase-like protein n=1 Tax=Aspergillus leporis TaxID=41062 RepID=A0A5N5WPN3_9EURO|nr:Metalloenzyme, LuxS/M16 peptidase-like protein [Aspergillus leporis]